MGVSTDALAPGVGGAPYLWEPGPSFAAGESCIYRADSPITFDVELIPIDENNELLHYQVREASGSATIK